MKQLRILIVTNISGTSLVRHYGAATDQAGVGAPADGAASIQAAAGAPGRQSGPGRTADSPTPITLPYSTEAGLFQLAGIPTVVCGPGSIDQAHKPNEFIEIEQLAAVDRFLDALEERLREPGPVLG